MAFALLEKFLRRRVSRSRLAVCRHFCFTKLEKGVTSRTQTKRYNFLARVSDGRQNGRKPK